MKYLFPVILLFCISCNQQSSEHARESKVHDSLNKANADATLIRLKKINTEDSLRRIKAAYAKIAEDERNADAQFKETQDWFKSKPGKLQAKYPGWTKEECEMVVENRIWIGMSYDMLVVERGKPDHKNVSNYGGGNEYQWCWDDYNISCFYDTNNDGLIDSYN